MNSNPGVDYVLSEPSVASTLGSTFSSKIVAGSISSIFSGAWLFGIALCAIATMGVYAYAGIRYENVDSGNKEAEIKEDLKRATYGLIGVLALWLLLNQINPELLRGEIKFNQPTGSAATIPASTPATTGTVPSGNTQQPTGASSEQSIRDTLAQSGITVNKAPCTEAQMTQTKPSCTNVAGLPLNTIRMLQRLRTLCGASCDIMITGGTEPGHSTHGVGRAPVDLRLVQGDALYTYITKPTNSVRSTPAPGSLFSATYFVTDLSWRFNDETAGDRHWHVNQ